MKNLPGVAAAQPMIHRFAYVGNDLQDIYGIDPTRIGKATTISNSYFASHEADATFAKLANLPDGVLVSEETRQDFQLRPGDRLNLRLQFPGDHQYHVVPFRFIGVVRESQRPHRFISRRECEVYSRKDRSTAAETVLVRAQGDPGFLVKKIRAVVANLPGYG